MLTVERGEGQMEAYTRVPAGDGADFAVRVLDDSLLPRLRPGQLALVQRRTDLRDGDVGLFYTRNGMAFRQFCRDSQGNVYLFAVNRRHRDQDLTIPRSRAKDLICYGKLLLTPPIPLPLD